MRTFPILWPIKLFYKTLELLQRTDVYTTMNNAQRLTNIDPVRFPNTAQFLAELEACDPSDNATTAPAPARNSLPPMSLANELAVALARGIFGR